MAENVVTSIAIAPFAEKNFLSEGKRKAMINAPIQGFVDFVNSVIESKQVIERSSNMDFCRYLFVPNFTDAQPSHLRIENSNAQWLRSAYEARTEKELPVLIRWFDLPVKLEPAKMLMLILYSREQLLKEAEHSKEAVPDAPWSVVSILALNEVVVPPMPPITIMRNSLGVTEGGNGVPLNRVDYEQAVAYWNEFAMVR